MPKIDHGMGEIESIFFIARISSIFFFKVFFFGVNSLDCNLKLFLKRF